MASLMLSKHLVSVLVIGECAVLRCDATIDLTTAHALWSSYI